MTPYKPVPFYTVKDGWVREATKYMAHPPAL